MTFMTVKEISAELGVSRKTIYKRIHSGTIPAVRIGNDYRVDPADLRDYINTHKEHVSKERKVLEKELAKAIYSGEISFTQAAIIMDNYDKQAKVARQIKKAQRQNDKAFRAVEKERKAATPKAERELTKAIGGTVKTVKTDKTPIPRFTGSLDSAVESLRHERDLTPKPRTNEYGDPLPEPEKVTYAHPYTNPYGRP